jgi:hypothetical protein
MFNMFAGLKGQALRQRDALLNPQHAANWQEDYSHENGQYENRCCHCTRHFIGHKRRVVCKICSPPMTQEDFNAITKECGALLAQHLR